MKSLTHTFLYTGVFCLTLSGCNLSDVTGAAESLDGTNINPKVVESPEGAQWTYLGGVAKFSKYFAYQASRVAYFTDELALLPTRMQAAVDSRVQTLQGSGSYIAEDEAINQAQSTRVQLMQAIQLLDKFYGNEANTMRAHAYGLLSMVHIMLADNFCSGIPLSESKWGGAFTPGAGYPTDSVYHRALSYAEKGLTYSTDSVPVKVLLLGAKARALNALGKFEEAAAVVAQIETRDTVGEIFQAQLPAGSTVRFYPVHGLDTVAYNVLNEKGENGIVWVADSVKKQDMRVPMRMTAGNTDFQYPLKPQFLFTSRRVAFFSGVEARLIEAESHLHLDEINEFINKINSVRRLYRTLGGVALADTVDPGTPEGRVNLLFRERAYTFYIAGRRLGDMRRLVRQYNRLPDSVWPVGQSEGSQFIMYGANYVFSPEVPGMGRESSYNNLYYECESYDP